MLKNCVEVDRRLCLVIFQIWEVDIWCLFCGDILLLYVYILKDSQILKRYMFYFFTL